MDAINLRKAKSSKDSNFAYSVKKAAFREYVEKVWGWDEAAQRRLHKKRFKAQKFYIISWNGEDVGIISFANKHDCVKVYQLFILPESQNKGIGSKCMQLILEEAQRMGLPIRLQVLKNNPRALAFYQRLGFARIDETETHNLMELEPTAH